MVDTDTYTIPIVFKNNILCAPRTISEQLQTACGLPTWLRSNTRGVHTRSNWEHNNTPNEGTIKCFIRQFGFDILNIPKDGLMYFSNTTIQRECIDYAHDSALKILLDTGANPIGLDRALWWCGRIISPSRYRQNRVLNGDEKLQRYKNIITMLILKGAKLNKIPQSIKHQRSVEYLGFAKRRWLFIQLVMLRWRRQNYNNIGNWIFNMIFKYTTFGDCFDMIPEWWKHDGIVDFTPEERRKLYLNMPVDGALPVAQGNIIPNPRVLTVFSVTNDSHIQSQ